MAVLELPGEQGRVIIGFADALAGCPHGFVDVEPFDEDVGPEPRLACAAGAVRD